MQKGATQAPLTHTFSDAQPVPSGLFVVVTHVGSAAGFGQDVSPVVHGFGGWHSWFGVQLGDTQAPSLQTSPFPHAEPFGTVPVSLQTGIASEAEQAVTAILQGFDAWHG